MGAHSGADIVNDGLVFYYDMNNPIKSWKGKPTVNQTRTSNSNTYHPSNKPFSGLPHSGSNSITTEIEPPVPGLTVYRIDDNGVDTQNARYSVRFNMEESWINYDEFYTWSVWIYLPEEYSARWTDFSHAIFQNSTGSDWHNTRGYNATYDFYGAGTIHTAAVYPSSSIVGRWQRFSVTFKPLTANIQLAENNGLDNNKWVAGYLRANITGAVSNGTPYHLYLAGGQLEQGEFASPFVEEERTTTAALVDISGKNSSVTLDSPSYTSDNTFQFNGGTERIYLSNIGGTGAFNNHFTISAWIKSDDITLTQNILSMNGPYFMRLSGSKVRFNVYAGATPSWLFRNGTTVLSSNTWYYLTMVWDGTAETWTGYINDKQEFSDSKAGPLAGNTNPKTFIGYVGYTPQAGEQSNFYGKISSVQYYNRALTDAEVLQNFEATRSLYGI